MPERFGPADFAVHQDVPIVPFTGLLYVPRGAPTHRGGPIWHDWDGAGFSRHHCYGRLWDKKPEHLEPDHTLNADNLFWAGAVGHHFGHQIMDFSMRLMGSLTAAPNAKLLFSRLPDAPVPRFFHEITGWFGIDPADMLIIDTPVRAQTLRIVPQAEQVHSGNEPVERVGPTAEYLNLMDRFIAEKNLPIGTERRPVFLSRAGVNTHLAGEAYLEWAAHLSGAVVARPETLPLTEQMGLVLSAQTLLISEGSASHLLSLAGRQFGTVHMLRRRQSQTTAKASLIPRCDTLAYPNLLSGTLCGLDRNGELFEHNGIAVLNEKPVLDHFAALGVDMRGVWDSDDFHHCIEADVRAWVKQRLRIALSHHDGSASVLLARIDEAFKTRPRFAGELRRCVRHALSQPTGPVILPESRRSPAAVVRRALTRPLAAKRPRFPGSLAER